MLIYAIGIDPNFMPSQTPTPQDLVEFTLILYQKEESLRYGKKLKYHYIFTAEQKKSKIANGQKILQLLAHLHTFLVNTTK